MITKVLILFQLTVFQSIQISLFFKEMSILF